MFSTGAMAGNQLYTGDAVTIQPGTFQLQVTQDTTPSRSYRIAGAAFTTGLTSNADMRLAYGYLWNDQGPDARVGPNIGFKYRFLGNGWTKPSAAISTLYAINSKVGGQPRGNDIGALLIMSYPIKQTVFLGNFGRVWIGSTKPDFYYVSAATVQQLNKTTIFALEYSDLIRIASPQKSNIDAQYAIGTVYRPSKQWSYGIQFAYLPHHPTTRFHTTIGISFYF